MEGKHGSEDFPFAKYLVCSDTVREFASSHWHSELEILYIKTGEITMNIDGKEYCGVPGDVFIVNSDELHEVSGKTAPVDYTAFVFDTNLIASKNNDSAQKKYIEPLIEGEMRFDNKIENADIEILRRIDLLTEECPPGFELLLKAYLLEFFAQMLAQGKCRRSEGGVNGKIGLLKEIVGYVDENFSQEISLTQIAERFNMSHKYFCRFFKNNFHKTFVEYLNQIRIEKAMTKLDEGLSVTETALSCGFENMSYFTLVFKRKTGVTPSEYKKN